MNENIWFVSIYLFLCFLQTHCRPLNEVNKTVSKKNVLDFMKRFGYLPPDTDTSAALYSEEGLAPVIKDIQKFGAIPQTGKLDDATLQLLTRRRCGVPDIQHKRNKRYILGSKGWNKRNLTYYIANSPYTIDEAKIRKDIKLALTTWASYGRLRFEEVGGPEADIIIAFAREYHGDNFPFDGQGSVLAHAFFPNEYASFAGDVHFDSDEYWTKEPSSDGIYFYAVALHELGHSLGLAHSFISSAIMFPYYNGDSKDLNLDYDDILGMYELYIRGGPVESEPYLPEKPDDHDRVTETYHFDTSESTSTPTTPSDFPYSQPTGVTDSYEQDFDSTDKHKQNIPTVNTPSVPDICQGNIDAAAMLREELFVFKDEYLWRLKEQNVIEENYPVPIKQMFPGLPDYVKHIDAAYERPDGLIVLFSGKEIWIYDGFEFVENSPQLLTSYGLPEYLDKIDAVQKWAKNGKTYFYRGDYFWRYNETSKTMDPGYPMDMSRWRGVPSDMDAAVTWKDGITYFFRGNEFWKFDNTWVIVTDTSPMPMPQIWFGCPKEIDLS